MAIREALDSEVSLIVATTLHSVGAIAVVAALITHIAWFRKLRHGIESVGLRRATFLLTVNGVAANLIGGFMRTYLPAHPTLTNIAGSPWVQVVLIKHLFIFAALGALIFLDQWVAPRLLRLARDGALPARTPTGHAVGSWIVVTGVIVSSVLGAMAQITPLGEGFDDDDDTMPEIVVRDDRTVRYVNVTGTLTSFPPLAEQEDTGTIGVLPDITFMDVNLIWSDPAASLEACLESPAGERTCFPEGPGEGINGPGEGTWRYIVRGENAVNVAWELSVRMTTVASDQTLLIETVTIAPETFFEINTQMPLEGSFHWDWQTSAVVTFDVHSHFDGEVQYHVEFQADQDKGSFTNDKEGGYSLLWANEGATPVTLEYRVWGDFEVDSYFPPR